jgi:hypothetical protein
MRIIEQLFERRNSGSSLENRLTVEDIRCADNATPSTSQSLHYFTGSGGGSVGIARLRSKRH